MSSAVVGGGLGVCRWIVNVEVDDEYHRDPVEHIVSLATEWELTGPGCGLLTAAQVEGFTTGADTGAECVTTVGLTHPTLAAGTGTGPAKPGTINPGTINMVCWVPAGFSDAALINAVVTATEAKT